MTPGELVDKVMTSEDADVVRESVAWWRPKSWRPRSPVTSGAEFGEVSSDRITQGNGYVTARAGSRAC
jgi:hypothetical protein